MTAPTTDDGPNLPPMRPGLPYTSDDACRALLAAVVFQTLADDDSEAVLSSPEFTLYCSLIGLSEATVFRMRLWHCLNLIDRRRFNVQCIDSCRYGSKDPRGEGEPWDSWKSLPGA